MLGDKYKEEREQAKKRAVNLAIKDIEKAPEDHDWSNTPLYKEYHNGLTELASLMRAEFALLMLQKIKQKKLDLEERTAQKFGEPTNTKKPLNHEEAQYLKTND